MSRNLEYDDFDFEHDSKDRRFVTALARGLDVLRCFEMGDVGLGNLELAKRTGLPKPTISRLTYTLTKLGYLLYSEHHGTYQLGPGVLQLGYAMLSGLDIRERARPLMQNLADQVDATIAFGARDRLDMVYLEACRGPGAVTLRIDIGSHVPLAVSAMGRALLAALPADERDYLMNHIRKKTVGAKAFSLIDRGVKQAIEDVATRGYTMSLGEWRPDVNAIGVPLQTHDNQVYALNCGGPAFRVSRDFLEKECAPRLLALASRISSLS